MLDNNLSEDENIFTEMFTTIGSEISCLIDNLGNSEKYSKEYNSQARGSRLFLNT